MAGLVLFALLVGGALAPDTASIHAQVSPGDPTGATAAPEPARGIADAAPQITSPDMGTIGDDAATDRLPIR